MRPACRPAPRTGLLLAAAVPDGGWGCGRNQAHGRRALVRGSLTGDCLVSVTPGLLSRRVRAGAGTRTISEMPAAGWLIGVAR